MKHKVNFAIVAYGPDGKEQDVVELTWEEYCEMAREMQWPEDLAEWDRLHAPVSGYAVGSSF